MLCSVHLFIETCTKGDLAVILTKGKRSFTAMYSTGRLMSMTTKGKAASRWQHEIQIESSLWTAFPKTTNVRNLTSGTKLHCGQAFATAE